MSDLKYTPEQLEALVESQSETIGNLQKEVAELKIAASAATLKKAASAETKPVIPESNVEVDGKEYKWRKAQFKVLGDATLYTAEEAQHDAALLKKIVAIPGQKILQEQV